MAHLFAAEELGILGSQAWLKQNTNKLPTIGVNINRDYNPGAVIGATVPPTLAGRLREDHGAARQPEPDVAVHAQRHALPRHQGAPAERDRRHRVLDARRAHAAPRREDGARLQLDLPHGLGHLRRCAAVREAPGAHGAGAGRAGVRHREPGPPAHARGLLPAGRHVRRHQHAEGPHPRDARLRERAADGEGVRRHVRDAGRRARRRPRRPGRSWRAAGPDARCACRSAADAASGHRHRGPHRQEDSARGRSSPARTRWPRR